MNIRLASTNDIAAIMQVMDAARAIMRASGNMHQWEDGYPSELVVMTDIERQGGYVIEEDDRVVAYFAFLSPNRPTLQSTKASGLTPPSHIMSSTE